MVVETTGSTSGDPSGSTNVVGFSDNNADGMSTYLFEFEANASPDGIPTVEMDTDYTVSVYAKTTMEPHEVSQWLTGTGGFETFDFDPVTDVPGNSIYRKELSTREECQEMCLEVFGNTGPDTDRCYGIWYKQGDPQEDCRIYRKGASSTTFTSDYHKYIHRKLFLLHLWNTLDFRMMFTRTLLVVVVIIDLE